MSIDRAYRLDPLAAHPLTTSAYAVPDTTAPETAPATAPATAPETAPETAPAALGSGCDVASEGSLTLMLHCHGWAGSQQPTDPEEQPTVQRGQHRAGIDEPAALCTQNVFCCVQQE